MYQNENENDRNLICLNTLREKILYIFRNPTYWEWSNTIILNAYVLPYRLHLIPIWTRKFCLRTSQCRYVVQHFQEIMSNQITIHNNTVYPTTKHSSQIFTLLHERSFRERRRKQGHRTARFAGCLTMCEPNAIRMWERTLGLVRYCSIIWVQVKALVYTCYRLYLDLILFKKFL